MPIRKSFSDMTRDSIKYLVQNTDITYFADGSIAKALVEATNLEISRLQEFVTTAFENHFLSSATGIYLDLFGEMLGLPRVRDRRATASVEDGVVRFYVDSGSLGAYLPDPVNVNQGLIPKGTLVRTYNNNLTFSVTEDVMFPVNARSVYVGVFAEDTGTSYNVGANQLVSHSLSSSVKVTNDIAITTGSDIESDDEYRFRLSRALTTRASTNATTIQIAALSSPSVSRVELIPFARGAGTFDVLLIPQGNRLTNTAKDDTRRSVEQVVAYGISPKIREPEYVYFKVTIQLRYTAGISDGQKLIARQSAESAVFRYFGTIPLGGELIINQLRSTVISADPSIKDMSIIELCLDGRARTIRNIQLLEDELLTPCTKCTSAVEIV